MPNSFKSQGPPFPAVRLSIRASGSVSATLGEPILHGSVIFDQLATQNFEKFPALMDDAPIDALLRLNIEGQTPVHVATLMYNTRFLETLLKTIMQNNRQGITEEADVDLSDKIVRKDSKGRSPVFYACESDNLSSLKLLLEAG